MRAAATSATTRPASRPVRPASRSRGFIREIITGQHDGSAITILEPNIFGGVCARVCPTETLCEGACVRMTAEGKPVDIGTLQRYATDHLFELGVAAFPACPATGRRVAMVGAGPAGLSCAHRLALLGHGVLVFEARREAGRPERIRHRGR